MPELQLGDRVVVIGKRDIWATDAGVLIAWEQFCTGGALFVRWGWLVELDDNCGQCYATGEELLKL